MFIKSPRKTRQNRALYISSSFKDGFILIGEFIAEKLLLRSNTGDLV